jgi:hypothetical protein
MCVRDVNETLHDKTETRPRRFKKRLETVLRPTRSRPRDYIPDVRMRVCVCVCVRACVCVNQCKDNQISFSLLNLCTPLERRRL